MKRMRRFQIAASCLGVLAGVAQAQISVAIAPDTVFLGQQFTVNGAGFSPNGLAVLHFAPPSGSELPTLNLRANASGAYSGSANISSSSSNLPTGLYRHWAVDQTTGTRSADVFITVTPARVFVIPRPTLNKIDNDSNGYFEEARLEVGTFASSGFHRIDVKLYRRDCQGRETLAASANGWRADFGPSSVFTLRTFADTQRELWDFRMDVFASGNADSIVFRIPYDATSHWTNLPMWDGTATCVSAALFPTIAGETVLNKPLAAYNGDTLAVEIRLAQNPQPIQNFAFTVQVDPERFTFVRAASGDLTNGFTVTGQEQSAGSGIIVCSGSGASVISPNSSGGVMRLFFVVQCESGALGAMALKNLLGDFSGLNFCCNAFICTPCENNGDIDHNKLLTPGDALCAFRMYLNGGAVPSDCAVSGFPCELAAADVNCDATITPGDALAIFQRYLQGLPPAPCFAQAALRATNPRSMLQAKP